MNIKVEKTNREHYLFDNKMLIRLLIPLFCEQLLAIFVGMMDSIMIAQVGEAAVSGVSLVDQIMVLFINAFAALATGGAVVTGQYLGKGNKSQACRSVTQLTWFVTILAAIITVMLYGGKSVIMKYVFGQISADVYSNANIYYMIVAASVPFLALYNCGAASFRAIGRSIVPMVISILMNIINVVGNAIFIFGFHSGTEGVAIPTLLSRVFAAVVVTIMLLNQKEVIHLEKTIKFRPDWSMIGKISSVGIPNGLENSMFQLGKIIVLSLVSTFGTYAIAANAVCSVLAIFQIIPGVAINMAVISVISQCVGLGDYEQVVYYHKKFLKLTYISLFIVAGLIVLGLPIIFKLYHLSPETEAVSRQIMYLHSICCVLIWPVSFTLPSTFRACGDAKSCMIISIISMWVFRIGACWIVAKYMGFGVFGVWVAMIIDWLFRSTCFIIKYFRGSWKKTALVS